MDTCGGNDTHRFLFRNPMPKRTAPSAPPATKPAAGLSTAVASTRLPAIQLTKFPSQNGSGVIPCASILKELSKWKGIFEQGVNNEQWKLNGSTPGQSRTKNQTLMLDVLHHKHFLVSLSSPRRCHASGRRKPSLCHYVSVRMFVAFAIRVDPTA